MPEKQIFEKASRQKKAYNLLPIKLLRELHCHTPFSLLLECLPCFSLLERTPCLADGGNEVYDLNGSHRGRGDVDMKWLNLVYCPDSQSALWISILALCFTKDKRGRTIRKLLKKGMSMELPLNLDDDHPLLAMGFALSSIQSCPTFGNSPGLSTSSDLALLL